MWGLVKNLNLNLADTETTEMSVLVQLHRCTRVENRGEGVLDFFAKIPRGVKAFRKNCLGGPPISGFIAFLLTSVLKFAWGGYYIYPPLPPTSPPLCASMWTQPIPIPKPKCLGIPIPKPKPKPKDDNFQYLNCLFDCLFLDRMSFNYFCNGIFFLLLL